jgi:hypothetical protein
MFFSRRGCGVLVVPYFAATVTIEFFVIDDALQSIDIFVAKYINF